MEQKVIPFGKYKDRPIEELFDADPAYLQWLAAQDWFRTKYVTLHQTIINYGGEPNDTPEHNALQVLFLEDDFCLQFLRKLPPTFGRNPDKALQEAEQERQKRIANLQKEFAAWQDRIERTPAESRHCWDYTKAQNGRKECEEQLTTLTEPVSIYIRRDFETGVDVALYASAFDHTIASVNIEIKPTVGDDYPSVLRQMRHSKSNVLFLEQYTGTGATREQFIRMFKTANIAIVFRDQCRAD